MLQPGYGVSGENSAGGSVNGTIRDDLMFLEAQHAAEVWVQLQYPDEYRRAHYVNGSRVIVTVRVEEPKARTTDEDEDSRIAD